MIRTSSRGSCKHEIDLTTIEHHNRGRVGVCKKCGTKLYLVLSREHPEARNRFKGSKKARLKLRGVRQKILERNGSPPRLPTNL